jgi:predicted Zn-ribbon and HTH transcriptional regulator
MLRLERQVKKKDLATLYGCHTVSISKFEKSESLNTDTIEKYCKCLGLDYNLVFAPIVCKVCGCKMIKSLAIQNEVSESDEGTISRTGEAKLCDSMKCGSCGHSFKI